MNFGGLYQHTGGMCDAAEFHEAVDGMADDIVREEPALTVAMARQGVLMFILAMVIPSGNA